MPPARSVVPSLATLTERGWIEALPGEDEGRKKEYQITASGRAVVKAELVQYGAFSCRYQRGAPNEYTYRALAVKDAGMKKLEYIAALSELGVGEVGSRGEVIFLRKKAGGTPFELFSDLDSRIARQKKARRYLRGGLLAALVGAVGCTRGLLRAGKTLRRLECEHLFEE